MKNIFFCEKQMNSRREHMLIISEEFQQLIPPLSQEEFKQLEENIRQEGCRDPIVVWNDTILDGHNRYAICTQRHLRFDIWKVPAVNNEFEAKEWIIKNQFGRRNINKFVRAKLALELKQMWADKAEANRLKYRDNSRLQNSVNEELRPVNTQQELAKEAGVSHDTIAKVDRIMRELRADTIEKLESGDISVNQAYQDIKSQDNRKERVDKINLISAANEDLATDKTYPVIYADPPWQYEHCKTDSRKIENQYPTMTLDEICALDVPKIAANDAILFLWTTAPKVKESLQVIQAWGFEYKTQAIWEKEQMGMGYYFRNVHEILMVATRGKIPVPETGARLRSVFHYPRGKHSAKPREFYQIIETMYPEFDKIELFCRDPQDGWEVWGNQANG
jgi:N6-adenosine-specific RNA methylase IME4